LVLTVPALALKVTVVEFAGTLTDAGTVRVALLEDKATAVALEEVLARVTVQVELPFDASVAGTH
jgi:hypothetical protein